VQFLHLDPDPHSIWMRLHADPDPKPWKILFAVFQIRVRIQACGSSGFRSNADLFNQKISPPKTQYIFPRHTLGGLSAGRSLQPSRVNIKNFKIWPNWSRSNPDLDPNPRPGLPPVPVCTYQEEEENKSILWFTLAVCLHPQRTVSEQLHWSTLLSHPDMILWKHQLALRASRPRKSNQPMRGQNYPDDVPSQDCKEGLGISSRPMRATCQTDPEN